MATTTIQIFVNYIKEILINQGKINFTLIAENAGKISHHTLTRNCKRALPWQTLYWAFIQAFVNTSDGFLVIDDTILEKPYSAVSRFVRYVFSHKDHRTIKGIQIVLLLFVVGNIRIPLGFRIYDKSKTKIELALDLLSIARNRYKLRKQMVLFDSWYSSKRILKRIDDYGWHYVCRIKKNRKVSRTQVRHYFPTPYGMKAGLINGMKVMVVRHGKYYLVSNYLSLSKAEIRCWYSRRSVIEEVFKELKSYFKAKDCQSRSEQAWTNHLYLVLTAFCCVEFKRQDNGLTAYKARRRFSFEDYKGYMNLLNSLLANA